MQNLDFSFLTSPANKLSRWWLLLGGVALALAGLFSLTLIIGRSPGLSSLPYFINLFRVSIAAHVDLSVLAWFLCIACLLWSLSAKKSSIAMLEESALISMGFGIALIALSPFTGAPALMSNYIPVIMSPVFFFGLALIGCSTTLMAVQIILYPPRLRGGRKGGNLFPHRSTKEILSESPSLTASPASGGGVIDFAIFSSALIALISITAFCASYQLMPSIIEGVQYFELLFWGGGHVLQFLHVQIVMVAWLFLLSELGMRYSTRFIYFLFLIGPIATLTTPFGYTSGEVSSFEHREFFTQMMIMVGGLAPAILSLLLLPKIWQVRGERKGENRALWSTLFLSVLLFLYGGILGGMIEGQNVVIPAHYHGSIIGITIAFMGLAYALLPTFGYRKVTAWKLAYWQPIIYALGQFMHITGLAVSGGYGVLRKTPGGFADVSTTVKVAMGFMGLGGVIAAAGGLLFVIVLWRAVYYKD